MLDAALLHEVIAGHDPCDSTSLPTPVPDVVAAARHGDVAGLRIGIIKELSGTGGGWQAGVKARFDEAVEALVDAGAKVTEVSCPSFTAALAAYYLILPSEASSNLAKFDAMRYGLRVYPDGVTDPTAEQVMAATREAGFGDEVKRRIILGTYALSSGYYDAYYGSAQKVRTLIQRDFAAAFEEADVLVSPTAPTTAFPIGAKIDDPLAMYLNDVATIPANLAGVPGMSLPSGLAEEDGLPTGLQILAPANADDRLYRVGAALEALLAQRWGGPLLDRVPGLPPDRVPERSGSGGCARTSRSGLVGAVAVLDSAGVTETDAAPALRDSCAGGPARRRSAGTSACAGSRRLGLGGTPARAGHGGPRGRRAAVARRNGFDPATRPSISWPASAPPRTMRSTASRALPASAVGAGGLEHRRRPHRRPRVLVGTVGALLGRGTARLLIDAPPARRRRDRGGRHGLLRDVGGARPSYNWLAVVGAGAGCAGSCACWP